MCLYHFVRISPCMSYGSVVPLNKRIHPNVIEFLQWWWRNLSINLPFHFRCDGIFEESYVHPDVEDEFPDKEHILFTLFDLAQHLDIDGNILHIIPDIRPKLTLANLETLRIRNASIVSGLPFLLRDEHRIRKLHIRSYAIWEFFKKPVTWWSSLTHLVFDAAYISSGMWFNIIRACVNLQFGYFDIRISGPSDDPFFANPPYFTHHHLRQLVVGWNGEFGCITSKYMLKNLFLPALTAFRISARLTTEDLHRVLESTPSLLELHLGREVAQHNIWYRLYGSEEQCCPEPLSKYVPNLQHLLIQTHLYTTYNCGMRVYINNLFSSRWLQLGRPTNNVRSLVIQALGGAFRWEMDEWLAEHPIHGIKVAFAPKDKPLPWATSTSVEKNAAKYFDEPHFCTG